MEIQTQNLYQGWENSSVQADKMLVARCLHYQWEIGADGSNMFIAEKCRIYLLMPGAEGGITLDL